MISPIGNDVDLKEKYKRPFCHRKVVAGTRLRKFDTESELLVISPKNNLSPGPMSERISSWTSPKW